MGNEEADKKFTWVIKENSLQLERISSDLFVIDGCKWKLEACKKKDETNSLYVFLRCASSLRSGWRRCTKYRLTFVNQLSEKLSQVGKSERWSFEHKKMVWFASPINLLAELSAKDGGFLVKGEVKVVVEIDVLEVIGELDVVSKETEEVIQPPLKKLRQENGVSSTGLLKETLSPNECIDVNGFQVLPSQVESVKLIFQKHPDIAIELRATNQHLRTACMNVLLNLIGTLCQTQLSYGDLVGTDSALTYIKDSGFKVDWLEQKLEEVKEKKKDEWLDPIRMQQLDEELKEFKQKCSDTEALLAKEKQTLKDSRQKCIDIEVLLKKEKTKLLATTKASPLKLDDIL